MENYFCANSVEEQVDYLTDKVKDLNTKKLDKAAVVQEVGTGTDVVVTFFLPIGECLFVHVMPLFSF